MSYYSQPEDIEELRAFCDLVDQERSENFRKCVRYARAWRQLFLAATKSSDADIKVLATDINTWLSVDGVTTQMVHPSRLNTPLIPPPTLEPDDGQEET